MRDVSSCPGPGRVGAAGPLCVWDERSVNLGTVSDEIAMRSSQGSTSVTWNLTRPKMTAWGIPSASAVWIDRTEQQRCSASPRLSSQDLRLT